MSKISLDIPLNTKGSNGTQSMYLCVCVMPVISWAWHISVLRQVPTAQTVDRINRPWRPFTHAAMFSFGYPVETRESLHVWMDECIQCFWCGLCAHVCFYRNVPQILKTNWVFFTFHFVFIFVHVESLISVLLGILPVHTHIVWCG